MSSAFAPPTSQGTRREPISQASVQKMLDENAALIQTFIDFQNQGKARECVQYQQLLHRNLIFLATLADSTLNLQQQQQQQPQNLTSHHQPPQVQQAHQAFGNMSTGSVTSNGGSVNGLSMSAGPSISSNGALNGLSSEMSLSTSSGNVVSSGLGAGSVMVNQQGSLISDPTNISGMSHISAHSMQSDVMQNLMLQQQFVRSMQEGRSFSGGAPIQPVAHMGSVGQPVPPGSQISHSSLTPNRGF